MQCALEPLSTMIQPGGMIGGPTVLMVYVDLTLAYQKHGDHSPAKIKTGGPKQGRAAAHCLTRQCG